MNATRNLTLALGLAAALASPALAQRQGGQGGRGFGGGGFMGGGSISMLLMAEPVQEELKLTDEQVEKLRPISEKLRSEMGSRMQEMRDQLADLSDDERRERFEQLSREVNATAREEISAVLEAGQVERLDQILLQQQGIQALASPTVAEKLGLNDEQKTQIADIIAAERTEVQAMMEGARNSDNPAGAFGRLAEVRRASQEKATAVLTTEQQATWKEMTGSPFEMPRGGFGRGGRQGGGRPGGNN